MDVDRPGYRQSDRVLDVDAWTFGMFAKDIEKLSAESLKIGQYFVLGHSSGGPCALACGAPSTDGRVLLESFLSLEIQSTRQKGLKKKFQ